MRLMLFQMRSAALLAGAIISFVLGSNPAFAQEGLQEPPKLAEDIHETVTKLPVTVTLYSGKSHTGNMIVTYFRPDGPGPFPVVVINHGRNSAKEKRAVPPRQRYTAVARYWTRRGFAVFVPTRLGYGDAGLDPDPEFSGPGCGDQKRLTVPMNAMLKQTTATLEFAKTFPWADMKRIVVMGQSYGGFGAVGASAEKWPGVLATINFSGGAAGRPETYPRNPCAPDQTASIIADAGKHAARPMLWLYAQNDQYWGADWPRKWHTAYVKGGGKAEMVMFPPVDDDGHKLIGKGFRLWRPALDRFLEKLGFALPKTPNAPSATDFARLEQADKLPYVKEAVRSDGYQKFLDADLPRAFVVSTTGTWVWRSSEGAADRALAWCRERSKGSCHLYAVDDTVVFKPPVTSAAEPAR